MKKLLLVFSLCFIAVFTETVYSQDDESRQSSGLPRMIGENAADRNKAPLSGKLTVQGLDPSQPKPTFFVVVYLGGAMIDRRQVDDNGNYYVPGVPREGGILAVEMSGIEVGRYQLPSSIMGSLRQDVTVNAAQLQSAKEKPGVVSAKDFYRRSEDDEKLYQKASAASREKKPDNAVKLFKQLVENDPKDFISWTELGTLYFKNDNFSEAEKSYNKAIEQKPGFILALVNLGKLYLAQKQAEKAVPILSKAVEAEPESADAQHYLGEAYLQNKLGSKAVIHLNEALRLAPIEKAEIHLRLATLYNAAGLKDKAAAEYKLFLEKVPKYPERDKIEKYIKDNASK